MKKNCRGSITVEACLTFTLFMFAFIGITSLSRFVRAESKIQYAMNQTAKEFSEYTYVFYRVGLIEEGKTSTEETDKILNDLDTFTTAISNAGNVARGNSKGSNSESVKTIINNANAISDVKKASNALYNDLKTFVDNPTVVMKELWTILKTNVGDEVKSQVVAPVICRILMPKYISDDSKVANQYLEDMGVVNGMNGLDFSSSTIMSDGKTINLVVHYKMKITVPMIGDLEYNMKQSSTIAAWTSKDHSLENVSVSNWSKSPDKRDNAIKEEVKKQNNSLSLNDSDYSYFDLYNPDQNTLSVITILDSAVFNNKNYSINEQYYKQIIEKEIKDIRKDIDKTESVTKKDGTKQEIDSEKVKGELLVYIPKGLTAKQNELQRLANEVAKDYPGISVKIVVYKEGK